MAGSLNSNPGISLPKENIHKKTMANRRDVGPILAYVRDVFLGRKNTNLLRFKDDISARTQPPPNLPEGPHHKLAGNYYYMRDARREVTQPLLICEAEKPKQVTAGDQVSSAVNRTPGRVFLWDA